jgi:hypothetical protein
MKTENIFRNKKLPLCLQKAKYRTDDVYIYGVPIAKLQTKQHRVFAYYKPVSKIIDYGND